MAIIDRADQPSAVATGSPGTHSPLSPTLRWSLAVAVFVGSFLFRLLFPRFHNDHFFFLSRARQIVLGDLPVRDFVDQGALLTYYASAAAQALFGYRLLSEALLDCLFLSAGATLTFLLATQASRSFGVGFLVTLFQIAISPRLYNYPKIFLPVAALFLFWRYVDSRKGRDLVLVALWTALAFLFRHDYGVYIAIAALVMVAATHWQEGTRLLLRRSTLYAAMVGVLLVPFFIFLALHGGIIAYFRTGAEFSRRETARTWLKTWPAFRFDFSEPLFRIQHPPLPEVTQINVRWAKGVSAEVRGVLEQRYHLGKARFLADDPRRRTWGYDLLEASQSNISALVKDTQVEDTHGINRETFHVTSPSESLLVSWLRRIPRLEPTFAPGLFRHRNALAWLYYLFVSLPVLAVLLLLLKHYRPGLRAELLPSETAKVLCAAVLCAAIDHGFLRRRLSARIADVAGPTAVLGAWLLGQWLASSPSFETRPQGAQRGSGQRPETPGWLQFPKPFAVFRTIAVVGVLGLTGLSVMAVAEDGIWFGTALSSPRQLIHHAKDVLKQLRTSPPIDAWAPPGSTGLYALTRYVRDCTKPTDRLLVPWFAPELSFYSGRGFAGGHVVFHAGLHSSPTDQQLALTRLQRQSVPIILLPGSAYDKDFKTTYKMIHEYLVTHYKVAREFEYDPRFRERFRVLVDRRLVPSGTYEPLSLPCFK